MNEAGPLTRARLYLLSRVETFDRQSQCCVIGFQAADKPSDHRPADGEPHRSYVGYDGSEPSV
jgi:hypothetical protein